MAMLDQSSLSMSLTIWAAVGPLAGIVVGHVLTRSWQRKQWYLDNRKQEYRELLSSLSTAYMHMVRFKDGSYQGSIEQYFRVEQVKMESFRTLRDRILIAKELENANILTHWAEAFHNFEANGDVRKFADRFTKINETLVDMAQNKPPHAWSWRQL